jgi:2-iminobutanoate/2-iminopropanoate deaminase
MAKKIISTDRAPRAIGPYSQAVDLGDLVFVSGQLPLDPVSGQIVGAGDIEAQTDRVLQNLEGILLAAELTMSQVVRTTVFMTDLADFPRMNQVYAKHFGEAPPARSTVQVASLPRGARIEIDAIARR